MSGTNQPLNGSILLLQEINKKIKPVSKKVTYVFTASLFMLFDYWVSGPLLAPVSWTQVSYFRCSNSNKVKGSLYFP